MANKKKKKKNTTKKKTTMKNTSKKKNQTSTKTKKVTTNKSPKLEAKKEEVKRKAPKESAQKITDIKETSVKELVKANKKKEIKNSKKKSNAKSIARTKKSNFLAKVKKLQRKIKIYGIESVVSKKMMAIIASGLIILLILVLGIKVLTKDTYNIDLASISQDIDQLKTVAFDIEESDNIVTSSNSYNDLKDYYEFDYKEFNLDSSWLENAVLKYNKDNKQIYFAIKPIENNEENVRNALNTFLSSKNISYEYLEYDGYQFYINSLNNKLVISKIKQTQIRVFDILQDLKKTDIAKELGIDSKLYKEATVKISMLKSNTTGYFIIKPSSKSNAKKIDNLLLKYFNSLEEKWQNNNNLENYNLVKSRVSMNYNGYLVYVISRDNDLVLQLIRK